MMHWLVQPIQGTVMLTSPGQLSMWESSEPTAVVNVSSVPQRSPFRYPGGKTWLAPRVRQWLAHLGYLPARFVEPFAGGAIIGLTVAFEQLAERVVLVERDEKVAAVWRTILDAHGGAAWLAERVVTFDLTPETVRETLASQPRSTREKALQAIVQNRTSHGGIMAPGAGVLKNGENGKGIRSRWYPYTIGRRILEIAAISSRLKFIEGDGIALLDKLSGDVGAVFFLDPPYTASAKRAGARLYRYHTIDHEKLFELAGRIKGDFLMTYDDAEEVRALAAKNRFETRLVAMSNTHHATMNELLIGKDLSWLV